MRGCQKEKVLFYLEGILSEEEKEGFQRHLEVCVNCQRELRELRGLKELLKNLPEGEEEINFSNLFSDFRRRVFNKHKGLSWRWALLPVGITTLILFFLFRPRPATITIPVKVSYYDLLENLAQQEAEYIKEKLGAEIEIDFGKLEEELLKEIPYEKVFQLLEEKERKAIINELISGGEI